MSEQPKKEKAVRLSLKGLSLEAISEAINKKYGANTLVTSAQATGLVKRAISTGVHALDIALGGGIFTNRVTEINGAYSSLKSTVMLSTIACFQRKYPKGLAGVIDLEHAYDPHYAHILGCDPNRTFVVDPDSGEQGSDVLIELLGTDLDMFIGVDSLAALVPTAELEASLDQQTMALQARLVNRTFRIATARMKRNLYDSNAASTTVLVLNQLRQKVGIVFGNPEFTPGGLGKDYYYSTIVTMRSSGGDAVCEKEVVQDVEEKVRKAQNVRFRVVKNKMSGTQFSEGDFTYHVQPYKGYERFSFNNEEVLMRFGLFYRCIQLRIVGKKKIFEYGPISTGKESIFISRLRSNPSLSRALYSEIMRAVVNKNGVHVESISTTPKLKLKLLKA